MKQSVLIAIATITSLSLPLSTSAENLSHLNQLLTTKQCSQCDLGGSGLVMSDLPGAQLAGANLAHANLSQANLAGANLQGANLAGASLYGANLQGANLQGANLTGTDLRNAYLVDADLTDIDLDTAYMEGAKGVPEYAGTPEQFYRWGVEEAERGHHQAAIAHYNQAIELEPTYAPAYLALGITQYNIDRRAEAAQNIDFAAQLFAEQENELGIQAAQGFQRRMELVRLMEEKRAENFQPKGSNVGKFIGGVGSLLLRLML